MFPFFIIDIFLKYGSPLQRLRTENRLLRQRIDCLEAESSALADRLIQGQVSRAEEAEHNFAIKVIWSMMSSNFAYILF